MKDKSTVETFPSRSDPQLLRELIRGSSRRKLRMPEPFESRYKQHHAGLALNQYRNYWPLAVVVVAILLAMAMLSATMAPALAISYTVVSLAVALSFVGVAISRMQRWHLPMVGLAAAIALATLHLTAFAYAGKSSIHTTIAGYGVTFVTLAMFTIAFLRLKHALFWCGSATLFVAIVAAVNRPPVEWQIFACYTGLSLVMGTFLGFMQEVRERTVFLQETLLAIENVEVEAVSRKLDRLSRHDALTGLLKHRFFNEVLQRDWTASMREGTSMNLLFMDVDDFKAYMDTYGQRAGNDCLAKVAGALEKQAKRCSDLVARYGGEGFVGLFPHTNREGLEIIAGRILKQVDALALPHKKSRAASHVTVSIGVASMIPERDNTTRDLMKLADAALFRAKEKGSHQFVTTWGNS